MNVHLFHDDKFNNGAMEQFESAYPGQNCYIILLYEQKEVKYTRLNPYTRVFHIRNLNLLKELSRIILSNSKNNRLFVHFLDDFKAALTNKLLDRFKHLTFYWIFYGGDLYEYLGKYKGYQIYDNPKLLPQVSTSKVALKKVKYLLRFGISPRTAKTRAFERLDYFCFWNEYDFELFHSKTNSKALYKDFIYWHALGNPAYTQSTKKNVVMLNHAASFSGNHHFVIERLAKLNIDLSEHQLLLPLSYGNKPYAQSVIQAAEQSLTTNISALTTFLPLPEYQQILSEVKIAIFGMRRQEAAGNIFQLLNMGAKIFLRKENTLLQWLKKRDFIVFCIEEDETELKNLQALSASDMAHNRYQYEKYFNAETYHGMMQQLSIDDQKND